MAEGVVRTLREGAAVPWSDARSEGRTRWVRQSWLKRLMRRRPKQLSVYQQCLAMHIGTASDNDRAYLS